MTFVFGHEFELPASASISVQLKTRWQLPIMTTRTRSLSAVSDGTDSDVYADKPESSIAPTMSAGLPTPSKRKRTHDATGSPADNGRRKRASAPAQTLAAAAAARQSYDKRWQTWQLIFTHVDPSTLARLLRVCKKFEACLTSLPSDPTLQQLHLQPGEHIWRSSRTLNFPDMPDRSLGCTEITLWRDLLGSKHCSICGHEPSSESGVESSTLIIWPFEARLCQRCLVDQCQTVRT